MRWSMENSRLRPLFQDTKQALNHIKYNIFPNDFNKETISELTAHPLKVTRPIKERNWLSSASVDMAKKCHVSPAIAIEQRQSLCTKAIALILLTAAC